MFRSSSFNLCCRLTSNRQLQSRKDSIEIELNERLRRRSDDLKKRVDSIGDSPEDGGVMSEDTLSSNKQQLKSLQNTIGALEKELSGNNLAILVPPFNFD